MCDICTKAVHGVAIWTRVTLGLDMCDICTEAVHGVAIWTRVTLGLDMCDIYVYHAVYHQLNEKWWIPQRRYWRREQKQYCKYLPFSIGWFSCWLTNWSWEEHLHRQNKSSAAEIVTSVAAVGEFRPIENRHSFRATVCYSICWRVHRTSAPGPW